MNLFAILIVITSLVTDTARTDLTLSGQFGQGNHVIEGKQTGGFAVKAQSIYDINAVSRVFGEASYQWQDVHSMRYVDNADFRQTSPYLTVDTIGGDMRREVYSFYGGYRMLKNRILWHAALGFRAEQSYRARDPRAKNKVSDLKIELSIGYQWSEQYAISLMGYGGRYKQNNEIRFYSELGEATIYHMANETEPYARFSSNNKISYYSGYKAGAGLSVLPTNGFMAGVSYDWFMFTKELTIVNQVPITKLNTHTLRAQLGYVAPQWRISASAAIEMKREASISTATCRITTIICSSSRLTIAKTTYWPICTGIIRSGCRSAKCCLSAQSIMTRSCSIGPNRCRFAMPSPSKLAMRGSLPRKRHFINMTVRTHGR